MGELIKGNAKVRTVLTPLPKDHELGRLMLRVYNHDREREHLIALLVCVFGGQLVVFIFEGAFNPSYLPGSTIFGFACVFSAVWLKRKYGARE